MRMTQPWRTLASLAAIATMSCLLAPAAVAAAETDITTILRAADRFRSGGGGENVQVETEVRVYARDGSLDKERRYTVFTQAGHKSLVLMRSPAEAGQKVLMLGDDYWLLMPGSQRALRITPTQKLLGDASTGDIATLSWAEDYTGTLAGEDTCDQRKCLRLSLRAARKGLSYQRIELWVGAQRHEPLRAELYVQSDKLAKLASFGFDSASAPRVVDEMVLSDRLGNHKETRVRYVARQPRQVPQEWLNPMFLARNPALE